jgi:hypothetical protein
MNLKPLPVHDRIPGSDPEPACGNDTAAITELFLLEECVAQCEALADRIASDPRRQALMADLSESIAACQTYLAGKSRESRYESRLRAYCQDVLVATAASCEASAGAGGSQCRKIIHAAVKFLKRHHTPPAALRS